MAPILGKPNDPADDVATMRRDHAKLEADVAELRREVHALTLETLKKIDAAKADAILKSINV